jgi:hypothetical protein
MLASLPSLTHLTYFQGDYLAGIDLPSSDEEDEEYEKSARVDEDREVQLVQVSSRRVWRQIRREGGRGAAPSSEQYAWACLGNDARHSDCASPGCIRCP